MQEKRANESLVAKISLPSPVNLEMKFGNREIKMTNWLKFWQLKLRIFPNKKHSCESIYNLTTELHNK